MARRGNRVDIRVRVTGNSAAQMKAVQEQFSASMAIMLQNTEQLNDAQEKAGLVTRAFGGSLKQIAIGALRRVGEAAVELAAKGVKELAAAMKDAVVHATGFEAAMAEVSTLIDTNEISVRGLSDSVRALNLQFGGGNVEQAKALYQTISAGATESAQAVAVLTHANRLALGGVTDVGTAVDGLTSVMNAYGVTTRELGDVSDRFFVAMRAGKTTVGELAGSIGTVAPIAKAAGISMDDLFSSLSAITTGGIETNKAAIFLRQAFTSLIKPTKNAKAEAHALGIEFNAAGVAAAGGFLPFLKQISTNEKLTSESLGKLFGNVRAMTAVMSLLNNEGGKFADILDQMQNKAGATDEAVRKMENTTQHLVRQLKAAGEESATAFGELVIGSDEGRAALRELLNTARGLARYMRSEEFVGAFRTALGVVTTIIENSGDAIQAYAAAIDTVTYNVIGLSAAVGGVRSKIAEMTREAKEQDKLHAAIGRMAQRYKDLGDEVKRTIVSKDARDRLIQEQIDLQRRLTGLAKAFSADRETVAREFRAKVQELYRLDEEDAKAAARRKAEAAKQAALDAAEKARQAASEAAEDAEKAAKKSARAARREWEEQERAFNAARRAYARERAREKREERKQEAREKREEEQRELAVQRKHLSRAQGIASTVGSLFSASFRGLDAFKSRVFSILEQIAAKVVGSIALRILLMVGGGFLGGPIGALLGGSTTALAGSSIFDVFTNNVAPKVLPGAATGGEIVVGQSGRDDVPIAAQRGEVIADTDTVRNMREFFGQVKTDARPRSEGSQAVPIVLVMDKTGNMKPAEKDRSIEDEVLGAIKRLMKSGHYQMAVQGRY